MKNGLDVAKARLAEGNSLVLVMGESVSTVNQRGVRPLLDLLDEETDLFWYSVADKVVGAGAAHIYALLGLRIIYAEVISEEALDILKRSHVWVEYGKLVPYIKNRSGDGRCPIEECVAGVEDSHRAVELIRLRLAELEGRNE